MYKQAINQIKSQGEGFRELAKKVLSWVINTKRTLSTAELQHTLAVKPRKRVLNTDFIPDIEIVGSVCAGLVTVNTQSDIIRLVHVDQDRPCLFCHDADRPMTLYPAYTTPSTSRVTPLFQLHTSILLFPMPSSCIYRGPRATQNRQSPDP